MQSSIHEHALRWDSELARSREGGQETEQVVEAGAPAEACSLGGVGGLVVRARAQGQRERLCRVYLTKVLLYHQEIKPSQHKNNGQEEHFSKLSNDFVLKRVKPQAYFK